MILLECISRFKDKNNIIVGYKLKDQSGNIVNVTPEKLKAAINAGKVKVKNLTLTSDNRLFISPEDEQTQQRLKTTQNQAPTQKSVQNQNTQTTYMSWNDLLSNERQLRNKVNEAYSHFNISSFDDDLLTILSNKQFRRLEDKTQVFPLDGSDFVRTRLTHSLEVATIAKEIAIMISQDNEGNPNILFKDNPKIAKQLPAVAECAGLLHDIGNPPFGHYGETFIRDYFDKKFKDPNFRFRDKPVGIILNEQMKQDFINFEGNAQALRIMSKCAENSKFYDSKFPFLGLNDYYKIGIMGYDLNLTYAVMNSIIKYPNPSINFEPKSPDVKKHKIGYYHAEEKLMNKICRTTGTYLNGEYVRHPIVFILEAADDIAYSLSDLEDSFIKNKFSLQEFIDIFERESDSIVTKSLENFVTKQTDPIIKGKVLKYIEIRNQMKTLSKAGTADDVRALITKRDNERKALFNTEEELKVLDELEKFKDVVKHARNYIGGLKKMRLNAKISGNQAEIKGTEYTMFRSWIDETRKMFIVNAAYSFLNNYKKIMSGTYNEDLFANTPSDDIISILKGVMRKKVYDDEVLRNIESSGVTIIRGLLDSYIESVLYFDEQEEKGGLNSIELANRGIPFEYRAEYLGFKRTMIVDGNVDEAELLYHRLLMVTDYVSGMTDSFAQQTYNKINNAAVH